MAIKPLKVYELNNYINKILKDDPILRYICVEGEISNFKNHYSGHMYFTLKDSFSKIKCVMFRNYNKNLNFNVDDGLNVIVTGYINLYEKEGSYQINVTDIKVKGHGDLYLEFEKLKLKLEKEGLFDKSNKKRLPFLPKKIGVVTSSTGAAVKDIITVIKRRMPKVEIIIFPVLVQGKNAANDICRGLTYFDSRDDIDLIIVGRGGGSIEELWAFNEETVARNIFNLNKPVISAVGHETDFTISDFVADLRAPTPSVAGELAVPELNNLNFTINTLNNKLVNGIENHISKCREKLKKIKYENKLFNLPIEKVNNNYQYIDNLYKLLGDTIESKLNDITNKISYLGGKLDTVSPLKTLSRGFTYIENSKGRPIKNIEDIKIDETLKLHLIDGNLNVKVLEKQFGGTYSERY